MNARAAIVLAALATSLAPVGRAAARDGAAPAAAPPPRVEGRPAGPVLTPEILFSEHLYDGAFVSPTAVAWSPESREFHVLDAGNRLVGIFDVHGYPVFAFGGAGLDGARDLAVERSGRILVLDGRARVRVFSYRGEPQGELALPGLEDRKDARIAALALDPDGRLVVAEEELQELLVYDLAPLRIRARFGGRGDGSGRFVAIAGIAADAERYVVLDQLGTTVQVFDHKGRFLRGWGEHDIGPDAFSMPSGIALHPRGWIVVADAIRSELKVFDLEGRFLGRMGGLGTEPGQLAFPGALAVDSAGRVAVAERGNGRIQVFRVEEAVTAPASPPRGEEGGEDGRPRGDPQHAVPSAVRSTPADGPTPSGDGGTERSRKRSDTQ